MEMKHKPTRKQPPTKKRVCCSSNKKTRHQQKTATPSRLPKRRRGWRLQHSAVVLACCSPFRVGGAALHAVLCSYRNRSVCCLLLHQTKQSRRCLFGHVGSGIGCFSCHRRRGLAACTVRHLKYRLKGLSTCSTLRALPTQSLNELFVLRRQPTHDTVTRSNRQPFTLR